MKPASSLHSSVYLNEKTGSVLTIRCALVKIPPSAPPSLLSSLGKPEELAQADFAHGIDLRGVENQPSPRKDRGGGGDPLRKEEMNVIEEVGEGV